ncbi:putative mif4g domain-containing protein [Erysiphe necator]|uniref:Putative mif4g domain-containing protein n=1 Tax=Uncinula necator TaxID=52586 RepID=A0A0B1P5T9_UNCNE|nr:putative mif4g domain-containing protein [Erysiphe necator]
MERKRKRELRELNARAWNGEKGIFEVETSLDSSLKKNTAFIKRLRTAISPATLSIFLHEIRTLILHKYLSEIISACYEGLCKLKSPGEIEAGIEIVSALHQRFGPVEFTEYLGWLVGKGLATPDKSMIKNLPIEARDREEKERSSRQRVLLRVVTELWLTGVLRTLDDVSRPEDIPSGKESLSTGLGKTIEVKPKPLNGERGISTEPFPLEVLKDLLSHDKEHTNLPLLVIFIKSFGWDVLGIKTKSDNQKGVEEDATSRVTNGTEADEDSVESLMPAENTSEDPPLASLEIQELFRNVLRRYFKELKTHLIRDQKAISKQAQKDAEAYVKSGQVFEDRQASFEKIQKSYERLASNAQYLADILSEPMPDLKENDDSQTSANIGIGLVKTGEYLRGEGDCSSIWADEDEMRFYENLVDLKGKVPGVLLEDAKKKKNNVDELIGKKPESNDLAVDSRSTEIKEEDSCTTIPNKTIGVQVDLLLARLPDLISKELVDQAAIDFCFLNSKASRNRLLRAVQEIPKGRSDLLPFYSRLVATLGKYMPDITKGLVDHLDHEFRSLQRRKEKEFLGQARLINIRYLAELTKFGVVPEHVIFYCLKVGLDDFSRMNIEIICSLLENCGQYLLRNLETSPRMISFLEILKRKKAVQHIGQQERMLIENAIYYVDPPVRAAIEQKERTPIDLFIRKLIYLDMNSRNYAKILKHIRRLHWEESEVVTILEKIFSKPGKVKYGNIHLLAILASTLFRYHQDFVTTIIDNLLEYIVLGLEQNDFKFNQRRLAEVKYLGELYNFRMVDHPVIFDTLYRIMTFGHGGPPIPGKLTPYDMPDDFFRIRLIATILETCGVFFNRGASGKKLDYFLSFLQYYIYTKDPLPMDIEFIVQDLFALTRPNWKIASNLEEASKAFQLAMIQDQKISSTNKCVEPEEPDSDGNLTGEIGNHNVENESSKQDRDNSDSDDEDIESSGNNIPSHSTDSEEEDIVVTRQEDVFDPEDEADFEREYAKMMSESLESRKHERKSAFDVPLPMKRKEIVNNNDLWINDSISNKNSPAGTMVFSLLTKRGNRQQTRTVALPSDSTLAIAMKSQQQAEREEQQRIKNLVLNYDLCDGDDQEGIEKINTKDYTRLDKSSNNRSGQRARKLQLSDVDWYDSQRNSFPSIEQVTLTNVDEKVPLSRNRQGRATLSIADQCLKRGSPRLTKKAIFESHRAWTFEEKTDGKK